jgi:hypothetical protein
VKYIFDKETCRYLKDVMLKDEDYAYDTYNFDIDSNMFMYFKRIITEYINLIKKWNKPALLLFGTEDSVTKKTIKYYQDKSIEDNIMIKHVLSASHVTPCMDSKYQLSKLQSAVSFYRQAHNISHPTGLPKYPNIRMIG